MLLILVKDADFLKKDKENAREMQSRSEMA